MNLDGNMAPMTINSVLGGLVLPSFPTLLAWDLHGWWSSGLIPWDRHPQLKVGLRGSMDTILLPLPKWEQL